MTVMRRGRLIASSLLTAASSMSTTPSSLAAMRWKSRVLLVSVPSEKDPLSNEQRLALSGWQAAAGDRDLVVVEIVDDTVRRHARKLHLEQRPRMQDDPTDRLDDPVPVIWTNQSLLKNNHLIMLR
jgi:hypothetical protein